MIDDKHIDYLLYQGLCILSLNPDNNQQGEILKAILFFSW